MADDEAEIYDGIRAQFPLSFGKQTKAPTPLEAIHNSTRRTLAPPPSSSSSKTLPSSSKPWPNFLPNPPPRQNPNPNHEDDASELSKPRAAAAIGPRLPEARESEAPDAGEEEDDGAMIGPPPPPPSNEEENDDGAMIGPPRAPPSNALDSDSDGGDLDMEPDEENSYRIPLSNEIVLKGHSKVRFHLDFCAFFSEFHDDVWIWTSVSRVLGVWQLVWEILLFWLGFCCMLLELWEEWIADKECFWWIRVESNCYQLF